MYHGYPRHYPSQCRPVVAECKQSGERNFGLRGDYIVTSVRGAICSVSCGTQKGSVDGHYVVPRSLSYIVGHKKQDDLAKLSPSSLHASSCKTRSVCARNGTGSNNPPICEASLNLAAASPGPANLRNYPGQYHG